MYKRTKKSLLVLILSSLFSSVSYADDLDILAPSIEGDTNLLFVFDLSGSMVNNTITLATGAKPTRLEVLANAFIKTIQTKEFDDVNVGLAVFSGDGQDVGKAVGHGISYPVSPITGDLAQDILNSNANFTHKNSSYMPAVGVAATDTSREYLETLVNDGSNFFSAGGGTPLIDALYEASLYFKGESPDLGMFGESDIRSAHPSTYTGSIGGAINYNSPITQCSSDSIILLTDGVPTKNNTADDIVDFINAGGADNAGILDPTLNTTDNCNLVPDTTSGLQHFGRCGLELAKFMATKHNDPTRDETDVKIYPIALELDAVNNAADALTLAYLDSMADYGNPDGVAVLDSNGDPVLDVNGDPTFKKATAISVSGNNAENDLQAAFGGIAGDAAAGASSFSAPSFSVDTSSLLSNGEFVYVPVFNQSKEGVWPGNLKKFKLVDGVLKDKNDDVALNASNALLETAVDFWKDAKEPALAADAENVSIVTGGAANRIPAEAVRNVYTDDGNNNFLNLDDNLNNVLFGTGVDDALKTKLVDYIRGANDDGSARNHMGDIIHSKPVQLSYASITQLDGSVTAASKVIFVGTNEGYLHAIDDATGIENYAFMPKELLKNINEQYSGATGAEHIYGVDGAITLWIDESSQTDDLLIDNGVVDENEEAYILFGLRRGGSTYTMLNVTDPATPTLEWSKSFSNANSWSQPTIANFTWGTSDDKTQKPVVVIGGGYNDDTAGIEQAGGNNVYVINALASGSIGKGEEIWSTDGKNASVEGTDSGYGITDAIPASIRVIDVDKDNSIDRLYFGDTGGNIWRIDLNAGSYDATTTNNFLNDIEFSKIAELGGTGLNDRKFFDEPDVAIFNSNGTLVTSIAVGSGDRPNPLSLDAQNKFFLFYDLAVTRLRLNTDVKVTLNTLADVTDTNVNVASNLEGWYLDLDNTQGEKVLSTPLIYSGKVLFNTLSITKNDTTSNVCAVSIETEGKLYVLDMFTGIVDFEEIVAGSGEILGSPSIVTTLGTCIAGDCEIEIQISTGGKSDLIDFPTPKKADGTDDPTAPSITNKVIEKVYWIDTGK